MPGGGNKKKVTASGDTPVKSISKQ